MDTADNAATEAATDTAETAAETPAETAPEAAEAAATPATTTIVADAPIPATALDIDAMDKDQLEAFAREKFGRELDKRKRLETLRKEVHALLDGSTQKQEVAAKQEEAKAAARAAGTPAFVRHRTLKNPETGEPWVFEWNPLYEGNADLEPVYED